MDNPGRAQFYPADIRGDKQKGLVLNWDLMGHPVTPELPIFFRAKGLIAEGHYHTDADKTHLNHIIFVIAGKMEMQIEYVDGKKETYTLSQGESIRIPPLSYHGYKVLEDIIFAEHRCTKFNRENPNQHNYEEFKRMAQKR